MATNTLGGLAGKARRMHRRDRADRAFADHLIDEYLEPHQKRTSADRAPIRGRWEFMPTLMAEIPMGDDARRSQLELPWDERGDDGPRRESAGKSRIVWSTSGRDDNTPSKGTKPRTQPAFTSEELTDSGVLRVARQSRVRMPLTWAREPETRHDARLSLRGFGVGCAIGGVAAALVLVVMHIAVG